MTIVKIETEEELREFAAEALHILVNLRHSKDFWSMHFGAPAKDTMKRWEARADKFLEDHGVTDSKNLKAIQVVRS